MNHIRFLFLVAFSIVFVNTSSAQQVFTKSQLKDPIISLLQDYQSKLGNIKVGVEPDPSGELIELFTNPRVPVVNNLLDDPVSKELSIHNYCIDLKKIYPEGVTMKFNTGSVRLGKYHNELGDNQYRIAVRVMVVLNAIQTGIVYENKQILEFEVIFKWDGEEALSLRIRQISIPEFHLKEIGLSVSSGGSKIGAAWIGKEERVVQNMMLSGGVDISYKYWIKQGFGLGSGIRINYYQSKLELDKFDSYMGKNPNLSNVEFNTSIYNVSIPVTSYFMLQKSDRFAWYASFGVVLAYRYWEEFSTTAFQALLNMDVKEVVSHYEWDKGLRNLSIASELEAGVRIGITNRLNVNLGISLMSGLSPLDKISDQGFEGNKFTGQYNPLWMDPNSRNFVRFAGIGFGICYILEKK